MDSKPILVRNGMTSYEAAKACVDAGAKDALEGLDREIWKGDPNWINSVWWLDDINERMNYIREKENAASE